MKEVKTKKAPAAIGPYSQGVLVGNILFVSGQIPLNFRGQLIQGSIRKQTRAAMRNLKGILNEAGFGFEKVAKTTIYLTDVGDFEMVNDIYKSYFSGTFPARETVVVKELPRGAKLEISMIAVK